MIVLRVHHIICMQSFIGQGYSEEFVRNFSNIINYINSNPYQNCISLINYCDDVCKYCPNKLSSNKCKNETFINYLDDSYKTICNLNYNIHYSLNEINTIIKNHLTISKFKTICSNCQWFGICSKLIKNII